jgi:hypothetical protein
MVIQVDVRFGAGVSACGNDGMCDAVARPHGDRRWVAGAEQELSLKTTEAMQREVIVNMETVVSVFCGCGQMSPI